jgi:hypothetical protein
MSKNTYQADEVHNMLKQSMDVFKKQMILLVRECAVHRTYRDLTGQEALNKIAERLEKMEG